MTVTTQQARATDLPTENCGLLYKSSGDGHDRILIGLPMWPNYYSFLAVPALRTVMQYSVAFGSRLEVASNVIYPVWM